MTSSDGCPQFQHVDRVSRRACLTIGGAVGLGLGLPDLLRLRAAESNSGFGSAKSVIFLFLHGGHPQHETWDPKPDAPDSVRGEFGDTATSLSGFRISELLPNCSTLANRLAVVRSMAHDNANHVQACLPAMSGHKHPPSVRGRGDFPPTAADFPHFGAVLDHLRPGSGELPNWVQLGPVMTRSNRTVLHGQSPGFLGDNHSAFRVDQDLKPDDIQIEAIAPEISVQRLRDRRGLLAEIDSQRERIDIAAARSRTAFYEKAFGLLTSDATHRAFDLGAEPTAIRERYGRNQVGQSCLLARRLVEVGVPFVNVHWCKTPSGSWDTHGQNFTKMKDSLGPTLDTALSALIEDIEQRGMLDDVLIMPMAEFGRTPQINKNAGRDHWPFVYTLAMAGAGLKRGVVEGVSDRLGAYPASTPYDPADMAATIYHLLGIRDDTVLYDRETRPHKLVVGKKIDAILA
ncbi:MAG: DUF1501 domain-containing protein [Planctomycetes bacterium]|nr:DUF1501 domain-containing protein [Planctomycetota bacterium]